MISTAEYGIFVYRFVERSRRLLYNLTSRFHFESPAGGNRWVPTLSLINYTRYAHATCIMITVPMMTPSPSVFIGFVATSSAAFFIIYVLKWYNLRSIMPPGPLGNPVTGNTSQMPAAKPWRRFKEWNEIYGTKYSLFPFPPKTELSLFDSGPVVSIFLGSTPVIGLYTRFSLSPVA